ncbi:MAG: hypothetical protein IIC04_11685 [Proteobacteria bacterium]|nr:hypothetical protein [Pseudomonadota bacterium]
MKPSRSKPLRNVAAVFFIGVLTVSGVAMEANAANPCAPNPCAPNPCAANPCAAKNPCAPAAAAKLTDAAAAAAYQGIKKALRAGYAKSGHPVATAYFQWRRYNKTPYVSETHGGRFVNNYANEVAKAYGKFEKAGVMPVGSVLAKDSFLVASGNPCAANPCAAQPCAAQPCAAQPCAANPCAAQPCAANPCAANPCAAQPCAGQAAVQPGPLFIMEKMEAGFSPGTDDWRYSMIMPNGAIYGVTGRPNAAKVDFCAECHGSISEEQDSLFFLPEEYR